MTEPARKLEPVAEAPAPKPTEIVVELDTPVQAHGEMVKKLTFREPTGKDMVLFGEGWPVDIDFRTGWPVPNAPVMAQVLSVLAAVPPSTIAALKAKDFTNCAYRVMGFFVPDREMVQF